MPKKSLNVIQLSDLHLFAYPTGKLCGLNTADSLQSVLSTIRRDHWPPDLILVTGDISQDKTKLSYERFYRLFDELEVPVYCLPGNHDDPSLMKQVLNNKKVRVEKDIFVEEWHLVCLDSTIPNSNDGRFSESELTLSESSLARYPSYHTLISFHHNLEKTRTDWLDSMAIANASQFFSITERYGHVRGIVWGHIHQVYDGMRKDVRLMGTPATSIQFKPQAPQFSLDAVSPGFRLITLHSDGRIDTTVRRATDFVDGPDLTASGY